MAKTKEEILEPITTKGSYAEKYIFQAMDEYAQQEAIEFAEWIEAERWEEYDGAGRWINVPSRVVKSTSQLYQLFINSKMPSKVK